MVLSPTKTGMRHILLLNMEMMTQHCPAMTYALEVVELFAKCHTLIWVRKRVVVDSVHESEVCPIFPKP